MWPKPNKRYYWHISTFYQLLIFFPESFEVLEISFSSMSWLDFLISGLIFEPTLKLKFFNFVIVMRSYHETHRRWTRFVNNDECDKITHNKTIFLNRNVTSGFMFFWFTIYVPIIEKHSNFIFFYWCIKIFVKNCNTLCNVLIINVLIWISVF